MCKRLICMVLFVGALVLTGAAEAGYGGYSDYLGGDRNLLFCGGHMGYGWYVDKSSLVVQEYNPPTYRIAVNVLTVPDADRGNTTSYSVTTRYYMYQWDARKIYVLNGNSWSYIPPIGSLAETGHEFSYEMAFYIAYHMKFYGGQKWRNPRTGQYESPNFSDALYAVVDGSN